MNQPRSCHEVPAELPVRAKSPENYGAALRLASELQIDPSDAQILISALLGCSRATLLAFSERTIDVAQAELITQALQRRRDGEPVAYLIQRQEFYGLALAVSPACLIPRADTETLVEKALTLFPDRPDFRVLDLGTGSGAIALALKSQRPRWQVHASDRSAEALVVATGNAYRLDLRVQFLLGDWFAAAAGQAPFDLIVSNPPYIADSDPHLTQGDLRFEPMQALSAGVDGLSDLRTLIQQAPQFLRPGGCLMLEHGYQQAVAVQQMLQTAGFQAVNSIKDLGENWRVSYGFLSLSP